MHSRTVRRRSTEHHRTAPALQPVEPLEPRTLLTVMPSALADLNPDTFPSNPSEFASVGGRLFFSAAGDDAYYGRELWLAESDGSHAEMVADINYEFEGASSNPRFITDVNGTAFFFADDGIHGHELWKSDGTWLGTTLVKDINPGGRGSISIGTPSATEMVNVNGTLYFLATDGVRGRQLWKSDGTADGTMPVTDVPNSSFSSLTALNGRLLYAHNDGLWITDGSPSGTQPVHDRLPLGSTTVSGNLAYYVANSPLTNRQVLWRTDGTTAGTFPLQTGPTQSDFQAHYAPKALRDVNGTLFFIALQGNSTNGHDLFKTDGTVAGTTKIAPASIPDTRNGYNAAVLDGLYYFSTYGNYLYRSDGTPEGTTIVRQFLGDSGIYYSGIQSMTVAGDKLYFIADDENNDAALWGTDGTDEGSIPLHAPLARDNFYRVDIPIAAAGERLYFVPTHTSHGAEPWITDGTPAGTREVRDINEKGVGSHPSHFMRAGAATYFIARPTPNRPELFRTDGTDQGTVSIARLAPTDSITSMAHFATGRHLYFVHQGLLYRADTATDAVINTINSVINVADSLAALGEDLYFFGSNPGSGWDLWKFTPGASEPTFVKDLGTTAPPGALTVHGDTLYFAAENDRNVLWRSDGTAAGTVQFKTGSPGQFIAPYFTPLGDLLLFRGITPEHGAELWVTDGTDAGTVLLKDVNPGPAHGLIDPFNNSFVNGFVLGPDGAAYFVASDGIHGSELWRTDGTPDGTHLVADLAPGPESAHVRSLTYTMGALYFGAAGKTWRSDGTAAGTVLLGDARDGADFTELKGRVYFSARDPEDPSSRILWSSDGTPQGTADLDEFTKVTGPISVADDRLVFAGSDYYVGSEPHAFTPFAVRTGGRIDVDASDYFSSHTASVSAAENGTLWIGAESIFLPFDSTGLESIVFSLDDGAPGPSGLHLSGIIRPTIAFDATVFFSVILLPDTRVALGANLRTFALEMFQQTQLDIRDHELVVQADGLPNGWVVRSRIASARNSPEGLWKGLGITSSLAQSNPLKGLAFRHTRQTGSVVKYTWNGDANLDGRVNADDYFAIDSGFLAQPHNPSYVHGDFNYDDRINADDYFLIDSAFLAQSAPMPAAPTSTAVSSPPSPHIWSESRDATRSRPIRTDPIFSTRGLFDPVRPGRHRR